MLCFHLNVKFKLEMLKFLELVVKNTLWKMQQELKELKNLEFKFLWIVLIARMNRKTVIFFKIKEIFLNEYLALVII